MVNATFGLGEINWGVVTTGNVTPAVAEVMRHNAGHYYIMTGKPFRGQIARKTGLVNETVPLEKLRARKRALDKTLLRKNLTVLQQAKNTLKWTRVPAWDPAEDYLAARAKQTAEILEVAVNPLVGFAHGKPPIALDALIVID